MVLSINSRLKLNNGKNIPMLGYGTWQIPDGQKVEECVFTALMDGYRLIDTAKIYENEIKRLGLRYNSGNYTNVMNSLNQLDFPLYIVQGERGEMPLTINIQDIKPEYIGSLQDDYNTEKEPDFQNAISAWMIENVEAKVKYSTFTVGYKKNHIDTVLSLIEVNIDKLGNSKGDIWMVIQKEKDDLSFSQDYKERSFKEGTGIKANDLKNIWFATTSLPREVYIYISPELANLPAGISIQECNYDNVCDSDESWQTCRNDCKPWGWAIILIVAVLFTAGIFYLLLAWWYERRYENSLFKISANNLIALSP